MKLLLRGNDRSEVDRVKLLLESRGIPVFVSNEDSARNMGTFLAVKQYGLFIVLDYQFHDATALLDDDTHEVAEPVDVAEYYRTVEHARPAALQKILNRLLLFSGILILVFYLLIQLTIIDQ